MKGKEMYREGKGTDLMGMKRKRKKKTIFNERGMRDRNGRGRKGMR